MIYFRLSCVFFTKIRRKQNNRVYAQYTFLESAQFQKEVKRVSEQKNTDMKPKNSLLIHFLGRNIF